ncbi:hypothetical protein A6S26_21635 [Nostoc sp. ATCC 43529]|nr:hypothetical protein A6S26_21635 [Nostoc sp. ATCC 43529]
MNLEKEKENVENQEQKVCKKYQEAFDSDFTQYKNLIFWGDALLKSGYFLDRLDRLYRNNTDRKKREEAIKDKRKEAIEKYKQALENAGGFEDDTSEIYYAIGNACLYNKNYEEAYKNYQEAIKRYKPIQKSGWEHPFDNNFRIWARQSYAIATQKLGNNDDLNGLMKESDQKALEIFENTYKEHKYLWEKWQSHHNFNEEDKKKIVDYLYNEAILSFFIPTNINVKPQLKEVERIKLIDYLDELKDKDLDWGLFFRDAD